jgi:hypothetical protein
MSLDPSLRGRYDRGNLTQKTEIASFHSQRHLSKLEFGIDLIFELKMRRSKEDDP